MRTLEEAASLLAPAPTDAIDALEVLACAIGFQRAALPLDASMRSALGLGETVRDAHVAIGLGTLRALLLHFGDDTRLRDSVTAVAAALALRAPHLLWLLVASDARSREVAIAAWSPDRSRPRVAALLVDRAHVLRSDAETLCALEAASQGERDDDADVLVHARWLEVLGRDALTARFYRSLESVVRTLAARATGRASEADRLEFALLQLSRLIFLSFLEAKGWLDGDRRFLERGFATCMTSGGDYHRRVLRPLFFGTLNTPPRARAPAARSFGRVPFLNGGLFARAAVERRARGLWLPDDALGLVHGELLTRYRFNAREESVDWSEAAIDPEMLGRAFESLMVSKERRSSGAFYTPHALVARVTGAALARALAGGGVTADAAAAALDGHVDPSAQKALRLRVATVRVLDPACGSGAFLVHALEQLAALAARLGDSRPQPIIRREVLTRAIFGVDVNPTAVWLCELRLWLSVVIESDERDPLAVPPLPNLDRHIRVGDSLGGSAFGGAAAARGAPEIARLRERYARASGARKLNLARELARRERAMVLAHLDAELALMTQRRRDLLAVLRGRDLFGGRRRPARDERAALVDARLHARALRAARSRLARGGALPFAWSTHFPDAAAAGGFDVIVGNPPWVRLHRIPVAAREALRARYTVFAHGHWERWAAAARAGTGFARQIDLAALFVERSVDLLRDAGVLALLLPAKLWLSLAGAGVRRLLQTRTSLVALEDWSESPALFDAAVYPSVVVCRLGAPLDPKPELTAALHPRGREIRWETAPDRIPIDDDDPASPWLLVPPDVRAGWDRMRRVGVALVDTRIGRPVLGVKSGCNDAFLVSVEAECRATDLAVVESRGRRGSVERSLLRPVLRGESVAAWAATRSAERIVWTHGPLGAPLDVLPPYAARWLDAWRPRLASRTDARFGRWWALFRTASASSHVHRVVWADFGRRPRAVVLHAGDQTVPLNSCYVLLCRDADDAKVMAALLNSPLVAAWLNVVAEPALGGYRRYLGWTVALLPLPRDWGSARDLLAPLADRALRGDAPGDEELLRTALQAYGLRAAEVALLLAWGR